MSFRFSSSDFVGNFSASNWGEFNLKQIADIANAKLDEWLSTGVKVYGFLDEKKAEAFGTRMENHSPTHEALLVNIKPIERECEHEPVCTEVKACIPPIPVYRCKHCHKHMKQKWELAE